MALGRVIGCILRVITGLVDESMMLDGRIIGASYNKTKNRGQMHFAKNSNSPQAHNCLELNCHPTHLFALDQRKNESPTSPVHPRPLSSFPSLPSFTHQLTALPHHSSASTPQRSQLSSLHTDSPKMRRVPADSTSSKAIFGIKLRKASQNNIIAEREESEAEPQDLCAPNTLQNLQGTPGRPPKLKERKSSCNLDFATLFQKGRKDSQNSMGMLKNNRREQGNTRKKASGWDENNNFQFTSNLNSDETHYSNEPSPLPQIPKLKNLRKQSQNESPKKQFPSFLHGFKSHRNSIDPVQMAKQHSRFGIQSFVIVRDLGKGTFGRVVLAMQRQSRALVAIKIMSKREIRDSDMVQQLIREIKIQQYICHPNVVKVYGFFDDLLHFYTVMECALDPPLGQTIKNRTNPISDSEAANTTNQICQAIAYLHSQSIIHRDLKPDNVLFHEGVVKISDFGWSVRRDGRLRSTFCGTPVYLCPEILVGDEYDQSVDIWTIGMIVYQLYCKSNPFRITCRQQLVNILNQPIYFDSKTPVPAPARQFITCCLAKRASDRPNIRQLLLHQFLLSSGGFEQLKR